MGPVRGPRSNTMSRPAICTLGTLNKIPPEGHATLGWEAARRAATRCQEASALARTCDAILFPSPPPLGNMTGYSSAFPTAFSKP